MFTVKIDYFINIICPPTTTIDGLNDQIYDIIDRWSDFAFNADRFLLLSTYYSDCYIALL